MIGNQIRRTWILLIVLLCSSVGAFPQRIPKPGFNLFSKDQDIQIGQEGVQEIEKKAKLVTNREVVHYIQTIGNKLTATSEAGGYPYTFKVILDDSINAFALPGGPVYLHTGLILAAENEAQLAGVMGHEISHIALRHGTNQASKANLLQLGAMVGGGLLGGGSVTAQLAQLGIGFGTNSVLLKFSRNHEREADILGARIMSGAGYNPIEMARFFEKLQAETGKRSGVEQFFSDHPNPGNRTQQIEQEIRYFPRRSYNADSGKLSRVQAILKGIKPPKASKTPSQPAPTAPAGQPSATQQPAPTLPSSGFRQYRGREFSLSYPENWQVFSDSSAASVTFAPRDGIVRTSGGGSAIARGIIVGNTSNNSRQAIDLTKDTERLIAQLRQDNPGLRTGEQPARSLRIDGRSALLTSLYSDSVSNGQTEIDLLLTVAAPRGLCYMVFIAPLADYRLYQPAFEKTLASVRLSK